MYSNIGWEIQTDMCVHKYACVCKCVSASRDVCIYIHRDFQRHLNKRGFNCRLLHFSIFGNLESFWESQPKGDSKYWGFPTLVLVVSLLIS